MLGSGCTILEIHHPKKHVSYDLCVAWFAWDGRKLKKKTEFLDLPSQVTGPGMLAPTAPGANFRFHVVGANASPAKSLEKVAVLTATLEGANFRGPTAQWANVPLTKEPLANDHEPWGGGYMHST